MVFRYAHVVVGQTCPELAITVLLTGVHVIPVGVDAIAAEEELDVSIPGIAPVPVQ